MLLSERNCATCTPRNKEEWGCNARLVGHDESGYEVWEDAAPVPDSFGDEVFFRCPRRPLLDDPQWFRYVLDGHGHYINGYLPKGGGVMDQPNAFMRCVTIIAEQVSRCEAAKAEKPQGKSGPRNSDPYRE